MSAYTPGDVLYASFPYTDLPLYKRRPVVVLSPDSYQKETGHIIGVMVTTAKDSTWPSDFPVKNLEKAGLKNPSFVRFKFFSLPADLIIKPLGRLVSGDKKAVLDTARKMIGGCP